MPPAARQAVGSQAPAPSPSQQHPSLSPRATASGHLVAQPWCALGGSGHGPRPCFASGTCNPGGERRRWHRHGCQPREGEGWQCHRGASGYQQDQSHQACSQSPSPSAHPSPLCGGFQGPPSPHPPPPPPPPSPFPSQHGHCSGPTSATRRPRSHAAGWGRGGGHPGCPRPPVPAAPQPGAVPSGAQSRAGARLRSHMPSMATTLPPPPPAHAPSLPVLSSASTNGDPGTVTPPSPNGTLSTHGVGGP